MQNILEFLNRDFLGNEVWRWLITPLIILLLMVLLQVLRRVFARRIRKFAEHTKTQVDDLVADLLESTKPLLLAFIALYAGSLVLTLEQGLNDALRTAAIIAALIQAAVWAVKILLFMLRTYVEGTNEDKASTQSAMATLGFIVRIAVWAVIGVLILDNIPGVEVSSLVAGLGITGIAVALAMQNILGDLFGSLSILLDKPFIVGDVITVGSMTGTVEHVGLKTTRVRSLQGEELVFSNSDLLNSRIQNFKRMEERRGVLRLGVTYETPYEKLERLPAVIQEVFDSQQDVRLDRAHFAAMGDFALEFEIAFYVLSADYKTFMDIQQVILLALFRRFQEEQVEFAYPTQVLYVNQNSAG